MVARGQADGSGILFEFAAFVDDEDVNQASEAIAFASGEQGLDAGDDFAVGFVEVFAKCFQSRGLGGFVG